MNFIYINRYKHNHSPAVWYVQQFDHEIPFSSIADVWPPSVNLLKFIYILKNGNNRLFFLYFSEGLVGWNFGAFVRTSISNIATWFLLNRYFESILDILELIACLTLDIKVPWSCPGSASAITRGIQSDVSRTINALNQSDNHTRGHGAMDHSKKTAIIMKNKGKVTWLTAVH